MENDVFEIAGMITGVSQAGVNYLQPSDAFQSIFNGYINRQVLQSRKGVGFFAPRLTPISPVTPPVVITNFRVMGIYEHTLTGSSTGEKDLLAFDSNFLYKYNTGTGVFDQVPFGGAMAAGQPGEYAGFNITTKDQYISGVSYPFANNNSRFVFVSPGIAANARGSRIFFYDGTNVLDYTDTVDNPNYADPPQGALTAATYVLWFNERINFVIPIIAGTEYNQGVLYSGIRDSSGNGDKFNVSGSGLFQADTYQNITGISILGQILVTNFNRSAYTLEKTRDAFNPYFGRAVPGVLGTNAKFSAVSWDDVVRSIGKTGILGADGRQNLRVDNKIPNFTADEIDQVDFNLTYGGFDRITNQFLWAYKVSESDSETQNAVLACNYEEGSWSIYDQRFSVFGQTDIGLNLTWDDIDETSGNESWAMWDTTEEIWDNIGLGQAVQKTLAGDDLGFIYQLNQDYDDYSSSISAVSAGNTTALTVTATGILPGDLVTVSNVEGMTELNNFDPETNTQLNDPYVVTASTPTTVTLNVNSSQFTPYTPNTGTVSKIIQFEATTIPFNPYRSKGLKCYVSHIDFLIDTNGGSLRVDVYSDEQESPFIDNVLCQPTLTNQKTELISMSVNQEANFLTFVFKQSSPAVQVRATSIRIYCRPGALING
jgi:hypothetical protein